MKVDKYIKQQHIHHIYLARLQIPNHRHHFLFLLEFQYTDTSGEESVRVDYYYMADRGLLVSVVYDKDHEKEIGKILDSFKMK